jgi:signal peptidase I
MKEEMRRFWKWLRGDSWGALVVTLLIAFILIKFIIFPTLSLATGTSLPLVIVESCSMYHSEDLETILANGIYGDNNIGIEDTSDWSFKNGFSKGDIIFVVGAGEVKVGEVIIFHAGQGNPIIHRAIKTVDGVTTKGDNNDGLLPQEQNIPGEAILGKAVFRVPFLGWIKLIFFEPFRSDSEKGLCS